MNDRDRTARAERLIAASPGALIEVDLSGIIVFANPAASELLRRPLDQIVGLKVDAAGFAPQTLEGAPLTTNDLPIIAALRGESVRDAEVTLAAPDGQRIAVSGAANPLHDENGKIIGAVLACSDLSAGLRVREALKHSSESKTYALAAAKMIAWDWDPGSGSVDHSEDVNHHLAAQVAQRADFQKLIHPEDRDRVQEAFERALRSGEDYLCQYRLQLPDNAIVWIESRGRPSRGPKGEARMSGVLTDITERKLAEIALFDSEERLRIAVEGAGAGFYDLDLGTGEGVWSRASFTMLGLLPPTDGRSHFEIWRQRVHPEDLEQVLVTHAKAEAELGPLVMDYRIIRGDTGEVRWLSTYGRIYQRPDGSRRSVGIVFDITERRRAEEREKLLMREVDHRAKNVLAVVQSLLQLTPRRDVESFVHGVTGRIAAIARVHTLLAQSRWRAASVFSLIRDELAPFRAGGQIAIEGEDVAVEPEVAQAIAMVVHELATNAAKHGALAVKDGKVSISLARTGDGVSLTWSEDSSRGAAEPGRHGFGMRLIRQLVERQLDGQAVFDWNERGLEARLAVKAQTAQADAPPQKTIVPEALAPAELKGRNVFVLEDDGLISLALQEEMERQGARTAMFSDIDSALSYLGAQRPDLAVLDVNVHGRAVAPVAVRLSEQGVPFVYATGYSDQLGELPRAPIVRKPCTPGEVCAALRLAEAPS